MPSDWYCGNHPPGEEIANDPMRDQCWACGDRRPPLGAPTGRACCIVCDRPLDDQPDGGFAHFDDGSMACAGFCVYAAIKWDKERRVAR